MGDAGLLLNQLLKLASVAIADFYSVFFAIGLTRYIA